MYSALIALGSLAVLTFLAFVCVGLMTSDPVGGGIFLAICLAGVVGLLRALGKSEMRRMGGPK